MPLRDQISSIPGVCDVEWFAPSMSGSGTSGSSTSGSSTSGSGTPGPGASEPDLLIECPHGATRVRDYELLRSRLSPELPKDLIDFFTINTDIGSVEYGREVARVVAQAGVSVVLVRCLIPRTFIDTNRKIGHRRAGINDLTSAVPDYIKSADDAKLLLGLYEQYQHVVERAFQAICEGGKGHALLAHTYAPKSVAIENVDEGIGKALRTAYEPENYARWQLRPEVDLITTTPEGVMEAPPLWVESVKRRYARLGVQVAENEAYDLHPVSMAAEYSARYEGQVFCLELRRDLLVEEFVPFVELEASAAKVAKMAEPIARGYLDATGRT